MQFNAFEERFQRKATTAFLWHLTGSLGPDQARGLRALLMSYWPPFGINAVVILVMLYWHRRYRLAADRAARHAIYVRWVRTGAVLHRFISPLGYLMGAVVALRAASALTLPFAIGYLCLILLEAYRVRQKNGPIDVARRIAAAECRRRRVG